MHRVWGIQRTRERLVLAGPAKTPRLPQRDAAISLRPPSSSGRHLRGQSGVKPHARPEPGIYLGARGSVLAVLQRGMGRGGPGWLGDVLGRVLSGGSCVLYSPATRRVRSLAIPGGWGSRWVLEEQPAGRLQQVRRATCAHLTSYLPPPGLLPSTPVHPAPRPPPPAVICPELWALCQDGKRGLPTEPDDCLPPSPSLGERLQDNLQA
jgi:hypothetical protein